MSEDGITFRKLDSLPQKIRTIEIHPIHSNIIFVGTDQGLYYSHDFGSSFKLVKSTKDKIICDILIDKNNPEVIYFSSLVWGVYKSTDLGNKFSQVICGMRNTNIYSLCMVGNTLYAGSDDWIYVSTNGGISWEELPKPPF